MTKIKKVKNILIKFNIMENYLLKILIKQLMYIYLNIISYIFYK